MARKKQPKRGWLRRVILLLVTPFIVWFVAFLLWFYWHDLTRWFTHEEPRRQPPPKAARPAVKEEQRERPGPEPKEKIFEEDRRKLEDILKKRN